MAGSKRGPRLIPLELPTSGATRVYAGAKIADALEEITEEMTFYHGVRLLQVFEAVYAQGKRDGHREVFDEFDKLKDNPSLKHRNPGRPRKSTAKRKAGKRKSATKRGASPKSARKVSSKRSTKRKPARKRT